MIPGTPIWRIKVICGYTGFTLQTSVKHHPIVPSEVYSDFDSEKGKSVCVGGGERVEALVKLVN